VFIDDATSALVALHFVEHESLSAYVKTLRGYIERQGCPMALYSDKHSVFHIGAKEAVSGTGETQYDRMLREPGIELIYAHTPPAKGRVARVNRTLQDRLVKVMRPANINDIEAANKFLDSYLAMHAAALRCAGGQPHRYAS